MQHVMHNGVGEKFEKKSPGTSDTQKTKVLLTLKRTLERIKKKMLSGKGKLNYPVYLIYSDLQP